MTNRWRISNSPLNVASEMIVMGADRAAIVERRGLVGTGGGELS